jgi:hypothetical protein
MTLRDITGRLRRIESRRGFCGDMTLASDRQLMAIVRGGYADLRAEHGSLSEAARRLRETGNSGDAALAALIEEDVGGPDARYH